RTIDPLFAMGVGAAAAALRIRREEKTKGNTTAQSWEALKRRVDLVWRNL
ncbi:hypothetical protein K470DRAFT_214619, partial [Piedraia hortae CBS 480.64]